VCGLLYAKGEPADERTHDAYHARALASRGVAVAGSRDPSAVVGGGVACAKNWGLSDAAHVSKDRWIVKCVASDHAKRWGKVKDVAAEVEASLGMSPGWIVEGDGGTGARGRGLKAFLCVVRGGGSSVSAASTGGGDRIVGALFAEPITHAMRTLPDVTGEGKTDRRREDAAERITTEAGPSSRGVLRCQRERVEAACGVRAVWVHPGHRREGVATELLETTRRRWVPSLSFVFVRSFHPTVWLESRARSPID
jgi:N-acetyltransferase